MDTTPIKTAKQVNQVMNKVDPLSKKGPLFLQQLVIDGKGYLVDEYKKLFEEEGE